MIKSLLANKKYLIVLSAILMIGLTGCEPLRKKFVRKKKQDRTKEVIPVLEPVDYPRDAYSVDSLYRHHYSLWKVWHKDLMVSLTEGDSDKRIIQTLDQLTLQLQSLQALVNVDRKDRLDEFIAQVQGIRKSYDKPAAIRNKVTLKNQAISIDRRFRDEFSYHKVRESLVPELPEDTGLKGP